MALVDSINRDRGVPLKPQAPSPAASGPAAAPAVSTYDSPVGVFDWRTYVMTEPAPSPSAVTAAANAPSPAAASPETYHAARSRLNRNQIMSGDGTASRRQSKHRVAPKRPQINHQACLYTRVPKFGFGFAHNGMCLEKGPVVRAKYMDIFAERDAARRRLSLVDKRQATEMAVRQHAVKFEMADTDNDQRLDLDEFRRLIIRTMPHADHDEESIRKWFASLDASGDGYISAAEFFVFALQESHDRAFHGSGGLVNFLSQWDENESGQLSFAELQAMADKLGFGSAAKEILSGLDSNGNGIVTVGELINAIRNQGSDAAKKSRRSFQRQYTKNEIEMARSRPEAPAPIRPPPATPPNTMEKRHRIVEAAAHTGTPSAAEPSSLSDSPAQRRREVMELVKWMRTNASHVEEIFAMFDLNGENAIIDEGAMRNALTLLGYETPKGIVTALFDEIMLGVKKITFGEIRAWLHQNDDDEDVDEKDVKPASAAVSSNPSAPPSRAKSPAPVASSATTPPSSARRRKPPNLTAGTTTYEERLERMLVGYEDSRYLAGSETLTPLPTALELFAARSPNSPPSRPSPKRLDTTGATVIAAVANRPSPPPSPRPFAPYGSVSPHHRLHSSGVVSGKSTPVSTSHPSSPRHRTAPSSPRPQSAAYRSAPKRSPPARPQSATGGLRAHAHRLAAGSCVSSVSSLANSAGPPSPMTPKADGVWRPPWTML